MRKLQDDFSSELERLYKYDKLIDALLKSNLETCESEAHYLSLSDLTYISYFLADTMPENEDAIYICNSLIMFKKINSMAIYR